MNKKVEIPTFVTEIASIHQTFRVIIEKMAQCQRWDGTEFEDRNFRQNSLQHSFVMGILAQHLAQREQKIGHPDLDVQRLNRFALIHDFAEKAIGDVTQIAKLDPRMRVLVKILEDEHGKKELSNIPIWGQPLLKAYEMKPDSLEARFFEAIENLDYFLFAVTEYVLHGTKIFAAVIYRSTRVLHDYANEFLSIGEIYTDEVHAWVEEVIEKEKDLIDSRPSIEAHPRHLEDMADAVTHLLNKLCDGDEDQRSFYLAQFTTALNSRNGNGTKP